MNDYAIAEDPSTGMKCKIVTAGDRCRVFLDDESWGTLDSLSDLIDFFDIKLGHSNIDKRLVLAMHILHFRNALSAYKGNHARVS